MHDFFLDQAYDQAVLAYEAHEVPVGCVIVHKGEIISRSHNLTNSLSTPLAHAELNALKNIESLNLSGRDLVFYITCEPCVMCLGILERLECTVYFGCTNGIFGGTSVVKCKKDFLNNMNSKKCYEILQKFYKRENINAPSDLRKHKPPTN
ncbi:tRNA-specific adenosine deaminase 2 (ADAT2) [Vairimorpha necatrix]|uniref:tRNA-specific adenosine deaminase 2 (ADAT2) n=1 Tax=Vairimorpha necatrix TaxID=6039 RepID=A0AAX4JAP1_9MICR